MLMRRFCLINNSWLEWQIVCCRGLPHEHDRSCNVAVVRRCLGLPGLSAHATAMLRAVLASLSGGAAGPGD